MFCRRSQMLIKSMSTPASMMQMLQMIVGDVKGFADDVGDVDDAEDVGDAFDGGRG